MKTEEEYLKTIRFTPISDINTLGAIEDAPIDVLNQALDAALEAKQKTKYNKLRAEIRRRLKESDAHDDADIPTYDAALEQFDSQKEQTAKAANEFLGALEQRQGTRRRELLEAVTGPVLLAAYETTTDGDLAEELYDHLRGRGIQTADDVNYVDEDDRENEQALPKSDMPESVSTRDSKTELIEPGQLSKALEKSLKERGKTLSDEQLGKMLRQLEASKAEYQTQAILTGIALLAKKSTVKHGKWGAALEQISSALEISVNTAALAVYMQLARRFLWKIEHNGFLREMVESDQARINCTASQVLALATDDGKNESLDPLFAEITRFVGGRSLRRMLADFRQAEKDAEDEAQREARQPSDTAGDTGGAPDPDRPDAPAAKPVQLLLWEIFQTRKLPILDAVFDEPGTEDLSGEDAILHYTQIADAFDERAKRARALAEAAKEGKAKSK